MSSTVALGVIGSSVVLGLLFEMLRRRQLREKYAVFWVIVAVATLVVALFPYLLARASQLLGVTVPSNLLFFVASMVLFVVSVQHSSELGKLEERNRTLAETVALMQLRLEGLEGERNQVGHDLTPEGQVDGPGTSASLT
jgi:hypothetical protein